MNSVALFLLLALPTAISLSENIQSRIVINLFASVSNVFFLCWMYSIAIAANTKILSIGINLYVYRYLELIVLIILFSFVMVILFSYPEIVKFHGLRVTFFRPLVLPFTFSMGNFFLAFVAARSLISAERNRPASFISFFPVMLMFILFPIGIWIIQPRVRRLQISARSQELQGT